MRHGKIFFIVLSIILSLSPFATAAEIEKSALCRVEGYLMMSSAQDFTYRLRLNYETTSFYDLILTLNPTDFAPMQGKNISVDVTSIIPSKRWQWTAKGTNVTVLNSDQSPRLYQLQKDNAICPWIIYEEKPILRRFSKGEQ